MVDAVVSYVVETLGDYLIQEVNFLQGVRDEVESLKKELEWMQSFIKDAEAKQAGNNLIRRWVSDIRDIAYDAEDVLGKYMLSVHGVNDEGTSEIEHSPVVDDEGTSQRWQGFFASIKKCSCLSGEKASHRESNLFSKGKEKVTLYNIGKEIEALKKRLGDVSRRCESYGLQNIIASDKKELAEKRDLDRLKELRKAASFAVEENPVGFEDDTDLLLAKLLDKEQRRLVISIYGMGGLGKTTLARKLYHNNDVKNKFDYCAWVSVSQDYKIKDLLLRIIKSFNIMTALEDIETKTEEDLARSLRKSLEAYSYLMVIDDIWHKEDWVSLKSAFPENKIGSRVIITTRIKDVAERSDDRNYVHELRFLRQDESWQLFCEKAFRNSKAEKGLENLGREMVQKCDGLPLAIVVLGGLLSTKRPQEWREVRNHIWRHLRNDSIQVSYLLDLSFNDLSHQLKLCFLYLSLFPEDFVINVEKLIRLLVAEGFIRQDEDRTMEEVAKDILDELINRSLIQVEKRCWGRISTCRVHDLLRDLAIQKAKELNFIFICDEAKNPTRSSVISSCRRQAIYSHSPSYFWLHHDNSLARSLLLFNQWWDETLGVKRHLPLLFERFFLLRVFDVEADLDRESTLMHWSNRLSEKIGDLIHLKYLGLRNSNIGILPSSIVKLQRLQTLDFSGDVGCPVELPIEINMMKELRHLIGNFKGTLPIENLTNLQTLKYVQSKSWNKVNTAKLVNLRDLHIEEDEDEWEGETVFSFESIAKLKNLRFLSVKLLDANSFASLQPLSHCQCLVDLRLSGRMKKLPEDMHVFLPNLECLSLSVPYPKEDPMPALEMLPNLIILDLHFRCHYVKKLSCRAEGFPLLEILQLDADGLVEWQVEEGAMPVLRGLKIAAVIPKLKIPERLRSVPPPAEWECEDSRNGF
ncbi:hypothetical protein AB3S75_037438 [Citrus x aurantiifolia]